MRRDLGRDLWHALGCFFLIVLISGCGGGSDPDPVNQAPMVGAGADLVADVSSGTALNGTVADDGLPASPGTVTTTWSQVSGPGTVAFGDALAMDTTASFSATGTYVLRLVADDGEFTSEDEVTVIAVFAWKVDAAAVAGGDGLSWATAFQNPREALAAASAGEEIWVAAGTYLPTTGTDRTVSFGLKPGVALYGGFGGVETVRGARDWSGNVTVLSGDIGVADSSGDNSYHVVSGADGAVLDGFTVTRGNASSTSPYDPNGMGGGMHNLNVSPTVVNCVFFENSAYMWGGGMHNQNSSPQVADCSFIGNVTTMTSAADGGAGMFNNNASTTVRNSLFAANRANVYGGGMRNQQCPSIVIDGCVFTGNRAGGGGGGIFSEQSSLTLTNSVFQGNQGGTYGGGMANNYSSPLVANCTFEGNTAANGRAFFHYYNGSPVLANSILRDGGSEVAWIDTPPSVTYSNVQDGYAGTGNIDADPLFAAAATPAGADGIWGTSDDGLALLPGSPCIDAADGDAAPAADILGNSRYDDPDSPDTGAGDRAWADMGAYEFL